MADTPSEQPEATVALAVPSRLARLYIEESLSHLKITPHVIQQIPDIFLEARNRRPDILLLSFDLGIQDINALIRLLKGHPDTRNIHILALSSSSETYHQALDAGADSFLEFPFSDEQLHVALSKAKVHRKKVLLVDDSKTIHEFLMQILKDEPYEIFHAFDGKEGTLVFEAVVPDLVVTDVEMPLMNGYDFCSWIKNHPLYARTPVIMSSTLSKGSEIDKGFDAGADDYLVKPVDPDEFLAKLRACLSSELKKQRELILVIDDSRVIQSLIGNALEMQGFRTRFASDGEEGVRLAKSLHPAMVITDCEMPGMNGREVARDLRTVNEFKHLPILMLTAKESQVEKAKARKAGVSEFVSKPFTSDKILVIVERLLAEAKVLREREAMMSYMSDAAIKQARDRAQNNTNDTMTAYSDHASILFSDICGFTSMSEKHSPETVITLLNAYFDAMVPLVKEHAGTVDKFIGDAIMAIFHGKSPEENALNAVRTGYKMLEKLKELNEKEPLTDRHIHIRIGINSGPVIFGDLGSRIFRRDFTVIGDNVNTAQRLESRAPKDSVMISDSTYILVRDHVLIRSSDTLSLKGKELPMLCHVLEKTHEESLDKAS